MTEITRRIKPTSLFSAAARTGGKPHTEARLIPVSVVRPRIAQQYLRLNNQGMIHTVMAWAGICCVLIIALWSATLLKISSEHKQISKDALKDASYISQSYADQITRSIAQIDQIALHLQYEWRRTNGALQLERNTETGVLPLLSNLHAWIADRNGVIQSSSYPGDTGRSIGGQEYFNKQQTGETKGLYIGTPTGSYLSERSVIHFSRKLTSADGGFMGVVGIAAEPSYLETFTSKLSLGANDSVTLKNADGVILASRRGLNIQDLPTVYRSPSVFTTDKGSLRMGSDSFVDGQARVVAWSKLQDYPLVSIVNQSEQDIYAGHREMARDYQLYAFGGSILLGLFALLGINFSSRLAFKRKQAEDMKNAYRVATEAAREGFLTVKALLDADKRIDDFVIVDCNDRGAYFIGFTKSSVIGARFSTIYLNARAQQVLAVFRGAMESGYYEDEVKLPARDYQLPVWLNRRIVRSGDGLAVTLRDISEAKAHEMELAKLANTDALTSLPNRHWMMGYLPASLEQAKKNHASLALLFIDLDNFKNINDTLGHAVGDEMLKAVATRLKSILRPGDNIVRLGGDEFTIISEGFETQPNVSPLAERIMQTLDHPFILTDGSRHRIAASIGISVYQEDGLDAETLLKHADIAMYSAKSDGKARYQFYHPQLSENLITRIDNEKALRQAIEIDEFLLYYQPRVDVVTGELKGLEALIRWQHPARGLVYPIEFIPFAEESGMIVDIGSLVIDKACRQISSWRSLGLPVVPVSVNVSAEQFNQGDLSAILRNCMSRNAVDASLLEVELTESNMIEDNQLVLSELAAIKRMGVKLLIDDFGTGYSSMAQLQRLDLDVLKIDQSFTRSLTCGTEGEALFKAMIAMAHALGMTVVAEGVESEEQIRIIRSLSCDEVQGYYISEPVSAEDVTQLIQRRHLFPEFSART